MPSPKAAILSFEDARHVVELHAAQVSSPATESVPILKSRGRVLAEPLIADRDFPPFPRATRDGYAVRAADVATVPVTLTVIGEIRAGASDSEIPRAVGAGEAVSIMTGAPAPAGSDAVVMVEYTSRSGDSVGILRGIASGENIVPTGAEAHAGDELVAKGTRLGAAQIAIAASVGKSELLAYTRPRIALLSTGDEIVDITVEPGRNQIRNSNSYSLAAQVEDAGGEAEVLSVAPDEATRLKELMEEGLSADLLLLTGGVSMGKYDLVEQVLETLHAEFFFTGAHIQPGRPIVFGGLPGDEARGTKYFFGLPGNPVSTMVTFELFAKPMIEALAGRSPKTLRFLQAKLRTEIKTKTGLKRFLPAVLAGEFEQSEVALVPWQGSGDLAASARANCYIVIPPDRERIGAGEWVAVLPR
jgi:molybdopterin molybdotransferase